MSLKVLLGLRGQRHQVKVVKPNGSARPELGRSHPEEENRRAAAVAAWGGKPSPRQQPLATIDEALPRRAQTILSHQVPPEVRQRLDTGLVITVDAAPRKDAPPAEAVDLPPAGDES
jgi:hypothetical protein